VFEDMQQVSDVETAVRKRQRLANSQVTYGSRVPIGEPNKTDTNAFVQEHRAFLCLIGRAGTPYVQEGAAVSRLNQVGQRVVSAAA
jgi:hypothetical protein